MSEMLRQCIGAAFYISSYGILYGFWCGNIHCLLYQFGTIQLRKLYVAPSALFSCLLYLEGSSEDIHHRW